MPDKRARSGRVLDAIVAQSVTDGLPSLQEAQEELRAVGLDPASVGRTLRERLVQATWRREAASRQATFAATERTRPSRPPEISRAQIVARIQRKGASTMAFRNAEKLSDDDLWDLLCDLDADDGR